MNIIAAGVFHSCWGTPGDNLILCTRLKFGIVIAPQRWLVGSRSFPQLGFRKLFQGVISDIPGATSDFA